MNLHLLKVEIARIETAISGIENIINRFKKQGVLEPIFYYRLQLPKDATVIDFFQRMQVSKSTKGRIKFLFVSEHTEVYVNFRRDLGPQCVEMTAFYGYCWLKNRSPGELLKLRNFGKKTVHEISRDMDRINRLLS